MTEETEFRLFCYIQLNICPGRLYKLVLTLFSCFGQFCCLVVLVSCFDQHLFVDVKVSVSDTQYVSIVVENAQYDISERYPNLFVCRL